MHSNTSPYGRRSAETPGGPVNADGISAGPRTPPRQYPAYGGEQPSRAGGRGVFDVFTWYPKYQSCQRYFLEVAQFEYPCQAMAAFLNIKLPYQRLNAIDFKHYQLASNTGHPGIGINLPPTYRMGFQQQQQPGPPQPAASPRIPPPMMPGQPGAHIQPVDYLSFGNVSLLPYIRRLVVTGYDADGVMHGWFGDDWFLGLNPMLEAERQNYMFAAKSSDWLALKKDYDTVAEESVPFLMPLKRVSEQEIVRAENAWSNSLSMRDWELGPRSIDDDDEEDQRDGDDVEPL